MEPHSMLQPLRAVGYSRALRNAMSRKTYLKELYPDITGQWSVCGCIETTVSDSTSALMNTSFKSGRAFLSVNHETTKKDIAANLRGTRPRPSDHWRLDEMVIVTRRKRYWLWRAVNSHENLVQMPPPARVGSMMNAPLSDLGGEHRAEPVPPDTHRLVANVDHARITDPRPA